MKLPRRQFLHLAAGTAAVPAMSRIAKGRTYPPDAADHSCRLGLQQAGRRTLSGVVITERMLNALVKPSSSRTTGPLQGASLTAESRVPGPMVTCWA